jgi:ATP-dependent Clp protease ATP-binding subunit ClpA
VFLNRLSDVFIYHPLSTIESRAVVEVELERMGHLLESRFVNLTFTFDSTLVEKLFELGFNREYGGRELKRTIYRNVTVPLARWASKLGKGFSNMTIALSWDGAGLKIEQLPSVGPQVTVSTRRAGKGRD